MSSDIFWRLMAVLALVGANGFFVAAEFALVAVRRTRIEQLAETGNAAAGRVKQALIHLDSYIAGTQVGITLASLALGWIGEPALARLIIPALSSLGPNLSEALAHTIAVAIAFTIVTFLHVILGELVPKSIALQKPEATSLFLARPLSIVVLVFRPLIWSLNGLGNLLLKAMGLRAAAGHESVHSPEEIQLLVGESHQAGFLDEMEKRMLQRAFRFSETSVSEIMLPRSKIVGLDLRKSVAQIFDQASESMVTRLPAYEESIDRIVGIFYVHDLFRLARQQKEDIRSVLHETLFVPESLHLDDMLERFRQNNTQIAIVVDEHGGTAGLITLEDIVETVFGQIQDQNEDPTPHIAKGENGRLIVRGDTRLVELNDVLATKIETVGATTLSGFIMNSLDRMPVVGDEIVAHGYSFRVTTMERRRVAVATIVPVTSA